MKKDYMLKRIGKYCQVHDGVTWYYFPESKFVYIKLHCDVIHAGSVTSVYRELFDSNG